MKKKMVFPHDIAEEIYKEAVQVIGEAVLDRGYKLCSPESFKFANMVYKSLAMMFKGGK